MDASGALILDLPELVIETDGEEAVQGSFEIVLELTGDELSTPPRLSTLNLALVNGDANLDLVSATRAANAPLFAGGDTHSFSTPGLLFYAHDVLKEDPISAPAFTDAGLATIEFIVPAGVYDAFPLAFHSSFSQMVDEEGTRLGLTLLSGSITVVASVIPEPGALAFVLIAAFPLVTSLRPAR